MDKILKRIVWLILIIPAVYLALTWKQLPERVVLHFDWTGQPDRLGNKNELITMILLLSVAGTLSYLLLTNIYRIDPKKYAAENRSRLLRMGFGIAVFISAVMCMIIYSSAHNNLRFNTGLVLAGTGLLFAFIGNYMPNMKPNYFAGFRIPWTLENEENWKKTHALGGKLWFIGGLALAVVCIFLPTKAAMMVFFSVMISITVIPIIYSYRLFLHQKRTAIK